MKDLDDDTSRQTTDSELIESHRSADYNSFGEREAYRSRGEIREKCWGRVGCGRAPGARTQASAANGKTTMQSDGPRFHRIAHICRPPEVWRERSLPQPWRAQRKCCGHLGRRSAPRGRRRRRGVAPGVRSPPAGSSTEAGLRPRRHRPPPKP